MNINIEIKDLDKMREAFKRSPITIGRYMDTAIKKSIYDIQAEATRRTPVDTGRLRQSVAAGASFRYLYGEIFPNVDYAFWVEVKDSVHHKTGEAHFLENSVHAKEGQVNQNFKDALGVSLEKIATEIN